MSITMTRRLPHRLRCDPVAIDKIRQRQAEVFELIVNSLVADHGFAPNQFIKGESSVLYILAEFMASERVQRGKNAIEIALMIDAWLELDDYARSLVTYEAPIQSAPKARHEEEPVSPVVRHPNARRIYH
jgi:hypothetical protein